MYTVTSVFVYTTGPGVEDPVVANLNSSRLVLKRAMKFSVADVARAYVRVSNGPSARRLQKLLVRHVSSTSIWYS